MNAHIATAVALLLALPAAAAEQGRTAPPACLQEQTVTRLDTLQVETCLRPADDPAAPRTAAASIRQTLTNVSKRPIELDVYHQPAWRAYLSVHKGEELVSKPLPTPSVDGNGGPPPTFDYARLEPGQSLRFDYRIADFLPAPPAPGSDYAIGIQAKFDYRFDDEPRGKAYFLRQAEERAAHSSVPRVVFEHVRLK